MFVGESGISRVVQRACELMKEHDTEDLRELGAIDLKTVQRAINFHFSVSVDLFGSEISTNAANSYTTGLKGRFREEKIEDDHQLGDDTYPVLHPRDGGFETRDVPALNAINERLRDDYVKDCEAGVGRWNKAIQKAGVDFELKLPHRAFHRAIGHFADMHVTPDGKVVSEDEWNRQRDSWLPTRDDEEFLKSIMSKPVHEPGKFAHWIAPPPRGINNQPIDFEYVRFA